MQKWSLVAAFDSLRTERCLWCVLNVHDEQGSMRHSLLVLQPSSDTVQNQCPHRKSTCSDTTDAVREQLPKVLKCISLMKFNAGFLQNETKLKQVPSDALFLSYLC